MKMFAAVLGLLMLFAVSCGGRSPTPDLPDPTDPLADDPPASVVRKPVLTEANCDRVWLRFDDVKSPGVIDPSFDSDPTIPGIQVEASAEYIYGRLPDHVRAVFLYDGLIIRTTKVEDGKHSAVISISKDRDGKVILIQLYTYGWCRKPGFMSLVEF